MEGRLHQRDLTFAITNDQQHEAVCYSLDVKEINWEKNELPKTKKYVWVQMSAGKEEKASALKKTWEIIPW